MVLHLCVMSSHRPRNERVGIRELRQNLSVYVKRVREEGRAYEVTERGEPVARLTPLEGRPMSTIERMLADGRITPATRTWQELPRPAAARQGPAPLQGPGGDAGRGRALTLEAQGVYLDASALVKLIIREAETAALRRYLAHGPPLYSSRIAAVEVRRAVARQGRRHADEQVEQLLATLRFVELDDELASAAGAAAPPTLRTTDAIHLASALAIADGLKAVVVYDARLAQAVRNAGLSVATPGQ